MLENRVKAIDVFYDKFMDIRVQDTQRDLKSPFVYIHRLDTNKPVGIHARTKHSQDARLSDSYFGYPHLEPWLSTCFHPQIKLETLAGKTKSPQLMGHIQLITIPLTVSPGIFSEPECSLVEVYHCAAAFTYEVIYSSKGPSMDEVNRIVADGIRHNTPINSIAEEASSIIDRKIMAQYKSLVKASQELYRYIQTKV